jgi:hypothetical protein
MSAYRRHPEDPIGSETPRGKASFRRKSGRETGLTPSEQHHKNQLMRQFMRNPEGTVNPVAYTSSAVWCCCGRGLNRRGIDGSTVPCRRCAPEAQVVSLQ